MSHNQPIYELCRDDLIPPHSSADTNIPPISRLPPELLGHIFFFTLPLVDPKFFTYPANYQLTHSFEPFLQIRHWRELVLSHPGLWSYLIIAGHSFSPRPLTTQLHLSGETKLHVCLGNGGGFAHMPRTLTAMIRSSERWVEATVCFNWGQYQTELTKLTNHVGSLETLHVRSVWTEIANTTFEGDERLSCFAIAPSLREFTLTGICDPTHSLVLPWHQLARYQATGNVADHLDVLQVCPDLLELDLTLLTSPIYDPKSSPVVRMPQLRIVYLSDPVFLQYLSLPALKTIVLDKWDGDLDALLPLLHLITRDSPPLAAVSLRRGVLVASTVMSLFEASPSLATLQLRIRRADMAAFHGLISRLAAPCGDVCFAPNLTTIAFEVRGSAFDDALFMGMVRARTQVVDQVMAGERAPTSGCRCVRLVRVGLALSPEVAACFWAKHTESIAILRRAGLRFWLDSTSRPNDVAQRWRGV
ncbi:hypothetical protein C8R43DRAFT_1133537 [Mycena crocata]|nr:hypothetical protein C8R43DRAFT_1133537 [Mycena crocata]